MILQQFNLTVETVLVTGGTRGLDVAMAKKTGEAGATVTVNGNSLQEKVNQAVKAYEEQEI